MLTNDIANASAATPMVYSTAPRQISDDVHTPAAIMAAARNRWPQWGPWKITVTHYENGQVEYNLFGKTPEPGKFENRVRCGRDLDELGRRVLEGDGS